VGSKEVVINMDRGQAEQLLNLIQSGFLAGKDVDDIAGLRDATVAAILRHKREIGDFDVFLCHNSANKPAVKRVGERLKQRGILPWLDEWELRPGIPWQKILEQQITSIKAAAVFVGEDGLGPWQDMELAAFIRQFVARQCPVIPVLLKSSVKEPPLPVFLGAMTYVKLAKRRPNALDRLVWGITGVHPDAQGRSNHRR
jgi:hypothetical protein